MSRRSLAFRTALLYGVMGALWILTTDFGVGLLAPSQRVLNLLQTSKGVLFILLTTIGLYFILRSQTRAVERERRRSEQHAGYQRIVAQLGQEALRGAPHEAILAEACRRAKEMLAVDAAFIYELAADPATAHLVAECGRGEGLPEISRLPLSENSPLVVVRERNGPVVIRDHRSDFRYKVPEALRRAAFFSSLWVPIGRGAAGGVLGVASRNPRAFREDEADYLQSMANILAQADERGRWEQRVSFQARLLEAVGQSVIVTDPRGEIVYWNQAAEELLGWSREEVLGKPILEVTPAFGEQARARQIMSELMAGREWTGEFVVKSKEGEEIPLFVKDKPMLAEDGQLEAVIGVSTDLREIRQIENRLRESEELHRTVLSNITDAVFLTDSEHNLTYVCSNVDVIFGYSVDEVERMGTIDALLGENLVSESELQELEIVENLEVEVTDKEGEEHHLLVNVRQVDILAGERLFVCRDVTDRRENEIARERFAGRLRTLHELDRRILASESLTEIAAGGLDGLAELMNFDCAVVAAFDLEADRGVILALRGHCGPETEEGSTFALKAHGSSEDGFAGSPVVELNATAGDFSGGWLTDQVRAAGLSQVLSARMEADGESLGVIALGNRAPDLLGADDAEALREVADVVALGIRSARLLAREKLRADELNLQRQAFLQISSDLALGTVLNSICEQAVRLLPGENCNIFLYEDGELVFGAARYEDRQVGEPYADPREDGLTYRVARSGERLVIEDTRDHPLFKNSFEQWNGSIIGHPIEFRGEVVGVMNLAFGEPRKFSESELKSLEHLVEIAAIAISNARLYDAEARQRRELESLYRIGGRLAEQYELDDVLDEVVRSVAEVVQPAEAASLWLFDAEEKVLQPRAWVGHKDEEIRSVRFGLGQSLVGVVLREAEPKVIHHAQDHPEFEELGMESLDRVQSLLGAPILLNERPIGVLIADNFSEPTAFKWDQVDGLRGLAHQAATAIDGARLLEQVRRGRDRLRDLSLRLVRVQEQERRGLARDLHDEIGQHLTGLKLTLEMAQERGDGHLVEELDTALGLIQDLLEQVRDISLRLRPSMLDDLGLLPTFLWQAERYEAQMGLEVSVSHEGIEGRRFPDEVETTAYRVAQEALTNIARHAQTEQAWLRVWVEQGCLLVQIQDEGVGFDAESVTSGPATGGLAGMRERVHLLGGRFRLEAEIDEGTSVLVELPLAGHLERRHLEDRPSL